MTDTSRDAAGTKDGSRPTVFGPVLAGCDVGLAVFDGPDLAVAYANPAHHRLLGAAGQPLPGRVAEAAAAVLRTGAPVRFGELAVGERFLQVVCCPVRADGDPAGPVTAVSVTSADITEPVRGRRRAEARHHRLTVLDDATTAITAELDPRREFIALAESVVPALTDACAIYLVDNPQTLVTRPDSSLQATRLVCVIDPALGVATPAPEVRLRLAPHRPTARAARSGEIVLASGSQADPRDWGEHWLTVLNPHSFVAVPIGPPDEITAVISFAAAGNRPRYEESDIALMREITARVDVAVGHALRLQHTSEVALALQRGLLSDPPELDWVAIRGCYRPAGPGLEVGGDWYDAVQLPTGGLSITVGDVVGHDLYAASTMGQLRSMAQALACQPGAEPAGVLTALNRLSRHLGVGELSTVVCGELTPATGAAPARFTWANAGHPPPMLIGPGPHATILDQASSPLLGLDEDTVYRQATIEVPTGSLLMLYTDGLMEDPERPEADTIAELAESAEKLVDVELGEMCDRLIAGAPARDDIALLVVRLTD